MGVERLKELLDLVEKEKKIDWVLSNLREKGNENFHKSSKYTLKKAGWRIGVLVNKLLYLNLFLFFLLFSFFFRLLLKNLGNKL